MEALTYKAMDEEIVTNELGAKQSNIGEGWELLDSHAISWIGATNMVENALCTLERALKEREPILCIDVIKSFKIDLLEHIEIVREVLVYGATKYKVDNWRGISTEDHMLHAYRHLIRYALTQESEDYHHCHCRLHMALAKALRPNYYGLAKLNFDCTKESNIHCEKRGGDGQ
jgi:hypothetical protein